MSFNRVLTLDLPLFVSEVADDSNSLHLRKDAWKFGFENKTRNELYDFLRNVDARPRLCAEYFKGFNDFDIIEFGPADGYNTMQLSLLHPKSILAIEGNADNFVKCLILKNYFNVDAKFLLGDFLKFIDRNEARYDLAYASGVLYHLDDPVEFILKCGEFADNIFLWSLYYDENVISNHAYEKRRFGETDYRIIRGKEFAYHKRSVDPEMLKKSTYQGGIVEAASWLTLPDIETALGLAGFQVFKTIPDSVNSIPAINIWASKARR